MNRLTRWLSNWRGLTFMAVLLAVIIPTMVVARSSTGDEGSVAPGQLFFLGVLLLLLVVVIARTAVMLAGVDPDASAIAQGLAEDPDQQRLLSRWLQRTRWARNVGGLAGLVWWVLGTSLQGDILLFGVGGIAVGSIAAQLHHVRRPSGPRTASLASRSVSDYVPEGWQRRMIVISGVSIAMSAAGLVLDDARPAVAWGLLAIGVVAVTHVVQRRVAGRPRPALATGLQQADDLARELAIDRGLARPSTYFALVLLAHGALNLQTSLGAAATAMAIGAWLYALFAWWQNRRLGLDHVIDRRQPVPSAA